MFEDKSKKLARSLAEMDEAENSSNKDKETEKRQDDIPSFPRVDRDTSAASPRQQSIKEAREIAAGAGYPTTYRPQRTETIRVGIELPVYLAKALKDMAYQRETTQKSIILEALYQTGNFDILEVDRVPDQRKRR